MSISYPSYPQAGDLEDGDDLTLLRRGGDVQKAATTTTALTPTVLVYICIAAVANILFGFENSAISLAKSDFAVEYNINKTGAEYGFLVGAMPIGATFACLFAGLLQDGLGRRITLILASCIYLGSAAMAHWATGFATFAGARLVTGVSIGIFSSTVPMYIAELAPPQLRGTLVTLNQVCICTGILLGYIVDKVLTPYWRWELSAGVPMAVAVLLCFIFVTPFSPRWLMSRGRADEARAVLMRIRGGRADEVDAEMAAIEAAIAITSGGGRWDKLREPHVMWGVAIGVIAALMQQWCGVNAVNAFAQDIFIDAGFSASDATTQAIYIGVAKLAFVIVALALMDRVGRKPLLLVGCAGMAASLLALALSFQLNQTSDGKLPKSVGITASAALILFMAFFEISLGPVLWLLLSELYPLQVKGVAMSVGSFTCWLMTYVVTQAFPPMQAAMGIGGVFFFFAAVSLASFLWIWVFLFETRGRTLEEIEDLLRGAPAAAKGLGDGFELLKG